MVERSITWPRPERPEEEVTMKRLTITCSALLMLVGIAAPGAYAKQGSAQPSAMERLVRQEDARWNDPRLGLAEKPSPQPSAIERLVRQENTRANDPRLGIATSVPASGSTPSVQIVSDDGFDWLAAAIGAIASAAALLAAVGLGIVVRAQHLRRA